MSAETEIQKLHQALEAARYELVTLGGAVATDRPELFNFTAHPECYWKIDTRDAIAAIPAARHRKITTTARVIRIFLSSLSIRRVAIGRLL